MTYGHESKRCRPKAPTPCRRIAPARVIPDVDSPRGVGLRPRAFYRDSEGLGLDGGQKIDGPNGTIRRDAGSPRQNVPAILAVDQECKT